MAYMERLGHLWFEERNTFFWFEAKNSWFLSVLFFSFLVTRKLRRSMEAVAILKKCFRVLLKPRRLGLSPW